MSQEMRFSHLFISVLFLAAFIIHSPAHAQVFGDRIDRGPIEYSPPITEASGIAASRKNPGVLWTHNDSGDRSRIYALNTQGKHLGVYNIDGIIAARDWEDIAVGPGPASGEQYIFIGDIGDNSAAYELKYIHRVVEPDVSRMQAFNETSLSDVDTITFVFPDGKRDAETLMIDPLTKDIYVVSKREPHVRVYRLPSPQSTTETITAEHVATLDLTGGEEPPQSWTVGGDISPSGREILIKTRSTIYYWSKTPEQDLWDVFTHPPMTVPYVEEPQGEAVTWADDARGYYTLSEGRTHLYFYPRSDEPLSSDTGRPTVLFEIGQEDNSDREFRSSGFKGHPEYTCHVGVNCLTEAFPQRLNRAPISKYDDNAVERITIVFTLEQAYNKVILRLVRGGNETTVVTVDEDTERRYQVTDTMLGSYDGYHVGAYDLMLGELQEGAHTIQLTVADDGKGNGTYQWDALTLFAE